jgi:hypothetical protein
MTTVSHELTPTISDAELHRFVSDALTMRIAGNNRLTGLQRRPYEYHSSFAIEELVAQFDDGSRLPLIFKNLGADGLLPSARAVRPACGYEPSREIAVYQKLLAPAALGTAVYYGGVVDPARERYWLLLEKVAGDELYKVGDFEVWLDVARWLANMQASLREVADKQQHSCQLNTFGEATYEAWNERACKCLNQGRAAHRSALEGSQLQWLVNRCRDAFRRLVELPPTFLHGEFYASNILVDRSIPGLRICAVDWETAALGPGLVDVAALVAGNWPEARREQLACAYLEALPASQNVWKACDDMMHDLRCCRLLQAIRWLGWSSEWLPPPEHRFDWLGEAVQMARTIESTRSL